MVFRKLSLVMSRIIEAALILLGIAIFLRGEESFNSYLGGWDLLAVVYLMTRMFRLRRSRKNTDSESTDWLRGMLGRRSGLLFTVCTSFIGITAGVWIVVHNGHGVSDAVSKLVAVPAVLLAWCILHFGYAERYAQAYYAALPEELLVFPNAKRPNFVDFAYFSFTLGTTFSVSDVETQSSVVRSRILSHSILSFVYNTATLGVVVGMITS